ARCCCAQGRHQRPQSAKGLHASFRPWVAVCLRRLSRRLAKARSHRLHGPARQSLRQRQDRELHEDTQGRSRVSDGVRNLRGRYSRPSPLHRRGLQHSQTPLRARLSEPRAIRGSPRPATCQNRRLKLSTIKGALHCFAVYLSAVRLSRLLGTTANLVFSRLLGVILAALAVQYVVDGLRTLWGT